MEQSSQKPDYPSPQAIHHELQTAENSASHVLAKLQSMKESNPNLTLLDVGAGSSTISVTFAKAIPDGHVTAIDLNPDILPRARAIAEMAGVKNIEFQQGDAYNLPFANETFDITFCHQMLTHLKSPWDALREMLRVTKPGGIVAAREGDLETECVWPELPGLLKFHKFAAAMITTAGGTSTGGRQLLSWALRRVWSGVRSQSVIARGRTVQQVIRKSGAMVEQVRGGRLREKGLKFGLVTENNLEEMAKDWEEWAGRDDASLTMMQGEILIQR